MRKLLFLMLCFNLSQGFAQIPTLSPGNPINSNISWQTHRDVTQPILSTPGTGPQGLGDLAWTTLAGDPSLSWSNAQAVSVPSCLKPFGQSPVPGTVPIWFPRVGCSSDPGLFIAQDDVIYTRKVFNVNSLACPIKLTIKADNNTNIFVNGQLVGSTFNNFQNGTVIDIRGFLNLGQNVIAIQVSDDGITGWMSCQIVQTSCL